MAGMTPHGLFHPMANSSIFHGKRLRWLSKTVSPWYTGPSDQQSRNLLPGKCGFSRPARPGLISLKWTVVPRLAYSVFYFRMKDHSVYAFAGLWDEWKDATGQTLRTCCLITTEPNDLLAKVHSRMPVILKPEDYLKWVSGTEPTELLGLLVPYPADQMEGYPVSTIVNKPQNDSPECIRPI
jgi:hypothetical protein